MPKTPSLFTQMSMGNDSNNARVYGSMTNALMLDHLAMIQVTIVNKFYPEAALIPEHARQPCTKLYLVPDSDAGFHPFHLHGHEFQVMGKTMDYLSNDTSINPPIEEQSNPMRRDTVTVPPGGATTIRFRADNPGAWLLHCHVEWHMNQGESRDSCRERGSQDVR
jgi:iron transport multicopper oxidase